HDPFQVGAAIVDALGELQDHGPVLLTVEDAHWSDSGSLQAVAYAFRRLGTDRVMLLLSLRPENFDGLPASLRRLVENPMATRMNLTGLPPADVEVLSERSGRPLTARAAQRLQAHTFGNPLYIK